MPRRGGRRESSAREKPSSAIRERVQRAREKQQIRFHSDAKVNCNARMGPRQIKRHCQLSDESQELIRVAMTEPNLSARAYDRILKVSRTVADLAQSDLSPPSTSAKPSSTAPSIERSGSERNWIFGPAPR
jgi:magnesium chelatase family protein